MNTNFIELDPENLLVTDEKGNVSISSSKSNEQTVDILQRENTIEQLKNEYNQIMYQIYIRLFKMGFFASSFILPSIFGAPIFTALIISAALSIGINIGINELTDYEKRSIKQIINDYKKTYKLDDEIFKLEEELEYFITKSNYKKTEIVEMNEEKNTISEIHNYSQLPEECYSQILEKPKVKVIQMKPRNNK